jgi:hypothetical protein
MPGQSQDPTQRSPRFLILHPDVNEPLDITIRKTYAQTKALFIVVKNLQLEVQSLQQTIAEANRLWARILQTPADRMDAAAESAQQQELRVKKFTK